MGVLKFTCVLAVLASLLALSAGERKCAFFRGNCVNLRMALKGFSLRGCLSGTSFGLCTAYGNECRCVVDPFANGRNPMHWPAGDDYED